jgi:hypothetical protein
MSNGSTGQPLGIALPRGGFGRGVTKRDTYPDGRDPVLQRGLDHLRQQLKR